MCNGICPTTYFGYDSSTGRYYYGGPDCNVSSQPFTMTSTTRSHTVGGDCNNCTDCIEAFFASAPKREAKGLFGGRPHLSHGVYRKGVGNPRNPGSREDAFWPGPEMVLLQEYTAEYPRPEKGAKSSCVVRLVAVAHATQPRWFLGLGWELDADSPPSPFLIPHLPPEWVTSCEEASGGHVIQVAHLGIFHVQTVGKTARGRGSSKATSG